MDIIFYLYDEISRPASISAFLRTLDTENTKSPLYFGTKRVIYKKKEYEATYYFLFFQDIGYYVMLVVLSIDEVEKYVYFGESDDMGVWVPYDKCKFSDDKKLEVFVSVDKKNLSPTCNIRCKNFGFSNQKFSKNGATFVATRETLVDIATQSWSTSYLLGQNLKIPLYAKNPPEKGTTNFERFFSFLIRDILQRRKKIEVRCGFSTIIPSKFIESGCVSIRGQNI